MSLSCHNMAECHCQLLGLGVNGHSLGLAAKLVHVVSCVGRYDVSKCCLLPCVILIIDHHHAPPGPGPGLGPVHDICSICCQLIKYVFIQIIVMLNLKFCEPTTTKVHYQ